MVEAYTNSITSTRFANFLSEVENSKQRKSIFQSMDKFDDFVAHLWLFHSKYILEGYVSQ